MSEKKRTISVSFTQQQIDQIDKMARDQRVKTGENVTRSQIARSLIDAALGRQQPPSPAGQPTPGGGRTAERSDGGAGGFQDGQEG